MILFGVFGMLTVFCFPVSASSFSLARAFSSHAVLQRAPAAARIWGFDSENSTVSATIVGEEGLYWGVTGADGVWRIVLPPHGAGGPYTILFNSTTGGSTVLEDILFGLVFLCGGQSNMQFSIAAELHGASYIADANSHPSIRVMTVGQLTRSPTVPLLDLAAVEQPWAVTTNSSIGDGDFSYFSALCYIFALDLQASATLGTTSAGEPIPFGLVSANWGGTCLQNWDPSGGPAQCGVQEQPFLYNANIHPFTVGPMSLEGVLWSQGECNADTHFHPNQTSFYACAFPLFIDSWRAAFQAPSLFFSFQVLPPYVNDSSACPSPCTDVADLRLAQLHGLRAQGGNVYGANSLDCGDLLAPHGSIHPRDKTTIARRMSSAAQVMLYGASLPYASPVYASAVSSSSAGGDLTVRVGFSRPPGSSGRLTLRPSPCPSGGLGGLPPEECSWFEIQTKEDGAWHNASGVELSQDGMALILTVKGMGQLVANASRAYYSAWPVAVLFSEEGLPAMPWWERVDS